MRNRKLAPLLALAALAGCEALAPKDEVADGGSLPGDATRPLLREASAHVAGPDGKDVRFLAKGEDPDANIAGLVIRVLDSAGQPVAAFDTDRDGVPDAEEGPVAFETSASRRSTIEAFATAKGLLERAPRARAFQVFLRDTTDQRSDPLTIDLTEQPIVGPGERCDVSRVLNRCPPGMGCRGNPATCQEGLAPQITRVAYLRTPVGPRILVEGTEPEDDLASVHLEFLDDAGAPVPVDLDGDDVADSTGFEISGEGASSGGRFFVFLQGSPGLEDLVTQIEATPADAAGHVGSARRAKLSDQPVRAVGQACDPRGFDVCAEGAVCLGLATGSAYRCQSAATARAAACKEMEVVEVAVGTTKLTGCTENISLWDAPPGCSPNDPTGQAERAFAIRLTAPAKRLTATTAGAGTQFDTVVYLLAACADAGEKALACNDDIKGGETASQISLEDLGAGTYGLVVDSFLGGGCFDLTVTVED